MSQARQFDSDTATVREIMQSVQACYGDLDSPDFRRVHANLDRHPYGSLLTELQAEGVMVTETTDRNDDVSVQLVLDRAGDRVTAGLSGVGPFAAIIHEGPTGRHEWISRPDNAPTPLARLVATAFERAGLKLLRRDTVLRTVRMKSSGAKPETTIYQALFTDSDRVP